MMMSCWAAGIAMLIAWKQRVTIDPVVIASNPGGVSYLSQFAAGLNPNDTTILRRWGLVAEAPQSYSPFRVRRSPASLWATMACVVRAWPARPRGDWIASSNHGGDSRSDAATSK